MLLFAMKVKGYDKPPEQMAGRRYEAGTDGRSPVRVRHKGEFSADFVPGGEGI